MTVWTSTSADRCRTTSPSRGVIVSWSRVADMPRRQVHPGWQLRPNPFHLQPQRQPRVDLLATHGRGAACAPAPTGTGCWASRRSHPYGRPARPGRAGAAPGAPRHTASIPSCGPLAASPTPSDAPPGCVTTPAQVWRLPSYAPELNYAETVWANPKGKGGELATSPATPSTRSSWPPLGGSRPGTATLAPAVLVPSPLRLVPVVSSTGPEPVSVGRLIGRAGRPGARRSTPPRRRWRPWGCRSGRCAGSCAAPRCRPGGTAAGPGRRWRPG
jgi:hypothetical protein